jgi:glutaminyl-peptide cyclotransferase
MKHLLFSLFSVIIFAACNDSAGNNTGTDSDPNPAPPNILFQVINQYPHDTAAFTQGLAVENGILYESTGLYGASWVGPVSLTTGKIDRKVNLNDQFFGEGIAILNGKVFHLTWQNKKGFVYDLKTFKKLKEFSYVTEGWGLTTDGKDLIMSDGSSNLFYLNPDTLKVYKTVTVIDNYGPVPNLNELEFIDGYIYANQWQTPYILKINPADGKVVARMDFKNLETDLGSKNPGFNFSDYVLNGIAYDSVSKKLFVTGKKWPTMYEIKMQ